MSEYTEYSWMSFNFRSWNVRNCISEHDFQPPEILQWSIFHFPPSQEWATNQIKQRSVKRIWSEIIQITQINYEILQLLEDFVVLITQKKNPLRLQQSTLQGNLSKILHETGTTGQNSKGKVGIFLEEYPIYMYIYIYQYIPPIYGLDNSCIGQKHEFCFSIWIYELILWWRGTYDMCLASFAMKMHPASSLCFPCGQCMLDGALWPTRDNHTELRFTQSSLLQWCVSVKRFNCTAGTWMNIQKTWPTCRSSHKGLWWW